MAEILHELGVAPECIAKFAEEKVHEKASSYLGRSRKKSVRGDSLMPFHVPSPLQYTTGIPVHGRTTRAAKTVGG